MAKIKKWLTRAQLATLARASMDNAVGLLDDAGLLLLLGRWPRAYALAVLAAEEYGKFYLSVVTALRLDTADDGTWTTFWNDLHSHRPKYAAMFGRYVDSQDWGPVGGEGDAEWLSAWGSRQEQAVDNDKDKQAGLYVSVDRGTGAVSTPAESIPEDVATRQVEIVASVVRPQAALFAGDLTALVTPTPRMQQLWAEAEALRASGASQHDAEALWKRYIGESSDMSIPEGAED